MCLAQESGGQEDIKLAHRIWLYMPFMHSEDLKDQEVSKRAPQCFPALWDYLWLALFSLCK